MDMIKLKAMIDDDGILKLEVSNRYDSTGS